ncbi:unnamed protein product [Adineta ricciae]|uniref:Uncharacterized protein n=1 Tax=Adineta ricciae TaxID=249248 RepID=A0A814BQZ8_ADIRI|nr:unnamed protein product [Adineta ricciae]
MSFFVYSQYCFNILLIFNVQSLFAYSCYDCPMMEFNYSLTVDTFPSPTKNACRIITAQTGCFVRVNWYNHGISTVFYGTNRGSLLDSVNIEIDRRVSISTGVYSTIKYIDYTCGSSNSSPCNTVENLQRSFRAVKFPSDEQINTYDTLIAPSKEFTPDSCFYDENMTDVCPKSNKSLCQRCMIVAEFAQTSTICAVCPDDQTVYNFFLYGTHFLVTNQTQLDSILIRCQHGKQCNSVANVENIRRDLVTQFDYDQFFYSKASTTRLCSMILLMLVSLASRQSL